ncbi:MAG: hypothetical protein WC989_01520 [Micavibrio sp.]
MGIKNNAGHLKLVSSFSYEAYPYQFEKLLENPYDGNEIFCLKNGFERAARMAYINDYKVFESSFAVAAYVRTEDEFDRMRIALGPETAFKDHYLVAPEGYDFRKLKHRRHRMQNLISKTALRGQIHLDVDRQERSIVVFAQNKKAYIGFRVLMDETLPLIMKRNLF